jgi:hypothetical protein
VRGPGREIRTARRSELQRKPSSASSIGAASEPESFGCEGRDVSGFFKLPFVDLGPARVRRRVMVRELRNERERWEERKSEKRRKERKKEAVWFWRERPTVFTWSRFETSTLLCNPRAALNVRDWRLSQQFRRASFVRESGIC